VPGLDLRALLDAVARPALAAACARILGTAALACDMEQSWWRRQYPPGAAPARHHAHAWHQDGALGHDFPARPDGSADAAGLVPLVTCWIALTDCGADAPGLELLAGSPARVLGLADLQDGALRAAARRQGRTDESFERPVLAAGDALVFGGAVVHRTHVAPAMTRVRTSLELRFRPGGLTSPARASSRRSAA
jgi:ectoine hydroxylase-related dioxygenase (phytanoyl-CoA dioxygenase family)